MSSRRRSTFILAHDPLTPIIGEPIARAIKTLTREVYGNAKSVPSNRGCGSNGHLAMVMSPEAYTFHSDEPFIVPSIPRELPSYADDATDAEIYYANFAYEDEVTAFQTYNTLQQTLRKQILTAVEPPFYHELEDREFGYMDVTLLQLLNHLTTDYGEITPQDLEENREKLRAPWNPVEDMTTVWNRIHDCIQFAAGNYDPISYDTAMCLTLEAFTNTIHLRMEI
ncbi:hypothetical protein IV203_011399 [Nitzschia inconspicua]|uniref:Uncharacterized protein n=1 Tax=Nitzschia inconspicua TaxID=303405 RepID=A0A9K3KSN1_9STRA|nr:hypothetical protein IV203_011399 [Nitzschia inconspicua]